jgi:hypothetical protein
VDPKADAEAHAAADAADPWDVLRATLDLPT